MKVLYTIILALAMIAGIEANAAYVENQPYQITQPDGTVIDCFVSGDEFFNWLHDADGYTIIQSEDGYFYYAVSDKGRIVPSEYRVETVNPESAGLTKWVKIPKEEYLRRKMEFEVADNRSNRSPHQGTMNNLVIYIKFSDDTEFTTIRQTFDNTFNQATGSSVKNFYNEVSYNMLDLSSTHYPECAMTTNLSYTDSHPRSYFEPYNATTNPNGYNGETQRRLREHALLRDAVNWINANSPVPASLNIDGDNDGLVDNISFIIRGGNGAWASLLWAHRWVLYTYDVFINGKQVWDYTFQPESQVSVGILCHELFHALGAPDLYHYNDGGLNISPVSVWDLMGSGSSHMGTYMKWKYSNSTWISSIPEITTSGTYTLNPITSSTNNCYKIASPFSSSEFFVVEYRQNIGTYESTLPGSGLLVYRIDPAYNGNASGPPDEVYLYRPNGTTTINGSPSSAHFSQQSGRTAINDATNPSSFLQNGSAGGLNIHSVTSAGSTITFSVGISTVSNPASFVATAISGSQIDLQWQLNTSQNNVLLAFNTTNNFGIPAEGTNYTAGQTIPGGGTVLFAGNAASFQHLDLSQATTYYYKLWSVNETQVYSTGLTTQQTTSCGTLLLPYTQNFQENDIPPCWTEQVEGNNVVSKWEHVATSNAGGSAGEMQSEWQQANPGITRLIMPPFNTTGVVELGLSFRHFLDAYSTGATLKIQSSSDGINWTDEAWSIPTGSSNIGPALVTTTITSNLNQPATYIAFAISGNLYNYDYWYIDDVETTINQLQSFSVTTTSAPAAGGTTAGSGNYDFNALVTVTASAAIGYDFINWTEGANIVSTDAIFSFNIQGNRNLVANFAIQQFEVSLSVNPANAGNVTGAGWYNYGSNVTVSAVAEPGYNFSAWTEAGNIISTQAVFSFAITDNKNLTAEFVLQTFNITTASNPVEGGTTSGAGTYDYGSTANLTANSANGWVFENWAENGTVVSNNPVYSFTVTENRNLIANFTQSVQQFTISTLVNPGSAGSASGAGIYNAGETATLLATPNSMWVFTNWTENGSIVSTDPSFSFAVNANRTLTANFSQQFNILANALPANGGYTSGSGIYTEGETAVLLAVANQGFTFLDWTENGNFYSDQPEISFIVDGNRELSARFQLPVATESLQKTGIRLYPNPSNGTFTIESDLLTGRITHVSISGITGNRVLDLSYEIPSEKLELNIGNLPESVYFVKIRTENGKEVLRKLIRKR
jgi:M6 family metalloprotease-like protein